MNVIRFRWLGSLPHCQLLKNDLHNTPSTLNGGAQEEAVKRRAIPHPRILARLPGGEKRKMTDDRLGELGSISSSSSVKARKSISNCIVQDKQSIKLVTIGLAIPCPCIRPMFNLGLLP